MKKKNYKGKCVKKSVSKAKDVCRTYNEIQFKYLDVLQDNPDIKTIQCNVLLESDELKEYTTDFVCVKIDGDIMVRECVLRKLLLKPRTTKLLDASRVYWSQRGIIDWGLVIDAEK